MTTGQAAKKWGVKPKWVSERCKDGIITDAEKKTRWEIPDSADKPPCSAMFAVKLIKIIMDSKSGKNVNLFPGNDYEKCIQSYRYLSKYSFITKIDKKKPITREIQKADVCSLGLELIEKCNSKKKITKESGVEIKTRYSSFYEKKKTEFEV